MKLVLSRRFELRSGDRFLMDGRESSYAELKAADPGLARVLHDIILSRRDHPLAAAFLQQNPQP